MQVSIATTNAKSFTPLSPPLSPDSKIGIMKPEESSIYSSHQSPIQVAKSSSSSSSSSPSSSSSSSSSSSLVPMNEPSARPKNKFRMRICDAPPELLELIKRSEEKSEKPLPSKSSSIINASVLPNVVKGVSTTPVKSNDSSLRKPGSVDEKRHRIRKNPYPRKAPSKSSPGITLRVDVYTTLKEDPKALLHMNEPSTTTYPTSMTNGFISSFTDGSSSGAESSPPHSPISHRSSPKSQISKTKTKTKRSKPVISERKRKGNSLARVMADRGLLESTLTPIVVSGEIKPIRIPPPPPMQFEELMSNIEQLNLDFTLLNRTSPKINWKGQPLSISHLPHYDSLHQKEAHVASTLRLTPVQYLTAKHTLISSARRYAQKSLPFRKSDAQKLLRIDVNKASKLWEFFMQVKWI